MFYYLICFLTICLFLDLQIFENIKERKEYLLRYSFCEKSKYGIKRKLVYGTVECRSTINIGFRETALPQSKPVLFVVSTISFLKNY